MRSTAPAVACALFCAVAAPVAELHGGVVATSRTSTIHVEGIAEDDSFDESDGTSEFGLFSDILSGNAGATAGTRASASAEQLSNVDASTAGLLTGTFNTEVDAFAAFDPQDVSGPLMSEGLSELTVLFQVTDEAEPYRVNGLLSGTLGTIRISLTNVTDAANPASVFGIFNDDEFTPPEFDESGTLAPGSYQLLARGRAASSGSSPQDPHSFGASATLNLDFAFGAEAAPIPLPPAVWTGATGLLVAACAIAMNRRRRIA